MFSIHGAEQIKLFTKLLAPFSNFQVVNVNLKTNFVQFEQIDSGRNSMVQLQINSTFFYDWHIEANVQVGIPIKSLLRILNVANGAAFIKFTFEQKDVHICILKDYTTLDYTILIRSYESNSIDFQTDKPPIRINGALFFGALKKLQNINTILSMKVKSSKLTLKSQDYGVVGNIHMCNIEHIYDIPQVEFKLASFPVQNFYELVQEENVVCEIHDYEPLNFLIKNSMFMLNFLIAPLL